MRDPVNPPSTEAEPQTAQGRNLLDDLPDYVDGTVPYVRRDLRRRILAIEEQARAEGRQQADDAWAAIRQIADFQRTNDATDDAAQMQGIALDALDRIVAGLNALR